MKVIAIVQARMSSSRLPGKVLKEINSKPVLLHIIERLKRSKLLDNIVVATSIDSTDDQIENFCKANKILFYRGDLEDVLSRFAAATKYFNAEAVVRITADCPLVDPIIVDTCVAGFLSGNYNFYGLSGNFPDGADCTVYSAEAIFDAAENATLSSDREHVGPYIERNAKTENSGNLIMFENCQDIRITLDEIEDFELIEKIFQHFEKSNNFIYIHEVVKFLRENPEMVKLNSHILRNEGYLNSLKND